MSMKFENVRAVGMIYLYGKWAYVILGDREQCTRLPSVLNSDEI